MPGPNNINARAAYRNNNDPDNTLQCGLVAAQINVSQSESLCRSHHGNNNIGLRVVRVSHIERRPGVRRAKPQRLDASRVSQRNWIANRIGKGTHAAVDRLQEFARAHRYVLRADIVKHFASMDHAILRDTLARTIPEADVMALIARIIASGAGVLDDEYEPVFFPGDDLLALCRPRGLPIGNLTSQFWSNCYLHPFDQFVRRELGCRSYLRYVDDFALFGDDKHELWEWKKRLIDRLAQLRLTIHESGAQVLPVDCGIPWLGFVVYPTHRRVKARNVRSATVRLHARLNDYQDARITFAEFDASVQGWINHVRYADTWGLRRHVFAKLKLRRRRDAAPAEKD